MHVFLKYGYSTEPVPCMERPYFSPSCFPVLQYCSMHVSVCVCMCVLSYFQSSIYFISSLVCFLNIKTFVVCISVHVLKSL